MRCNRTLVGMSFALGLLGALAPRGAAEVTLTFMNAQNQVASQVEAALGKMFEAQHPGVKVVYVNASLGGFESKLKSMAAAGVAPDVVMVHSQMVGDFVNEGLLMPLNTFFKTDKTTDWNDIFPSLRKLFTADGDIMAIPYSYDPVAAFFYNVNLWRNAGLTTPASDWTYAQFVDDMKKLTHSDGSQTTQYGTYSYHPNNWMYSWGGTLTDDWTHPSKITFDSPAAEQGLKAYVDLFTTYGVAPRSAAQKAWGGGYTSWFSSGKIASVYTGLWASQGIQQSATFNWDITLPPVGAGPGRGYELAARGYGISKETQHPELAWELARFLAYSEVATSKRVLTTSGVAQTTIPARLSLAHGKLYATNALPPAHKMLIVQADPYLFFVPRDKHGLDYFSLVSAAAAKAVEMKEPLSTALQEAAQQARGLLQSESTDAKS